MHEVIDDEEGDKLYMSKYSLMIIMSTIVMDYAEYGEVMRWDTKKCVFHPYNPKRDHLTENEIKKVNNYMH